jgi:prepilin-type N-terminal cleavage/methylation domain-containing protein
MKLTSIQKIYFFKKIIAFKNLGYSMNELVVVISIIGILASILVPSFRPAIEFIEVLMAEKYLLKAAQECKVGMINGELSPVYSLPENEISLGVFKETKFSFSYTGVGGECSPQYGGNELRVSRKNTNSGNIIYSLIINVATDEKTSEGSLPNWLDWWDKKPSTAVIDN